MSKFCPLYSSSSGNSIYVSSGDNAVLVDVGATAKGIFEQMQNFNLDSNLIKAVFLTHAHIDHCKSVKTICEKLSVPLIATSKTISLLETQNKISNKMKVIPLESMSDIANFKIDYFYTQHDCDGSCGYVITLPDLRKIGICTDLGIMEDHIRQKLNGCDLIYIESNYDINMLKSGPYPPETKARILSNDGHLSNIACAAELPEFLKQGTAQFILGHLSQNNNLPAIAENCSERALNLTGAVRNRDYFLNIAGAIGKKVFYL